jgi:hypothetical protein
LLSGTERNPIGRAAARKYWEKHAPRFGSSPVYLAVETAKIFPGEVPDLWPKLINSETTASFFPQGFDNYSNLELLGIMIFDPVRVIS